MAEIPLLSLVLDLVKYATLPLLAVAFVFGGRGLFRSFLLVCALAAAWLVWFFTFSGQCCPTGMEGLTLIFTPVLLGLFGLWCAIWRSGRCPCFPTSAGKEGRNAAAFGERMRDKGLPSLTLRCIGKPSSLISTGIRVTLAKRQGACR